MTTVKHKVSTVTMATVTTTASTTTTTLFIGGLPTKLPSEAYHDFAVQCTKIGAFVCVCVRLFAFVCMFVF